MRDKRAALLRRLQKKLIDRPAGDPLIVSGVDPGCGNRLSSLRHCIHAASKHVTSSWRTQYVPESYVRADEAFEAKVLDGKDRRMFLAVGRDLAKWLDVKVADEGVAEYLHRIGSLVLNPRGVSVCTNPQMLSKLMSPFVCSNEHAQRLELGARLGLKQRAVVTDGEAKDMIRSILAHEKNEGEDIDHVSVEECLNALVEWDMCVILESWKQCSAMTASDASAMQDGETRILLFPALRPTNLVYEMPQLARSGDGPVWKGGYFIPGVTQAIFNCLQV